MAKTIVVVGYGPGVSAAMAEKFGAEGFSVALVGRTEATLAAGVEGLKTRGITADAFPADAGDPASIRSAIVRARAALGLIGVIHWNAYSGRDFGDLLAADPAKLPGLFDVALVGLLSAVQEALADLKAAGDGAVLVTNGAFGEINPMIDAVALALGEVGVPLGNAAKAKLVGLLSARLRSEGVYVGEVTIAGVVRGTGPESPGIPTLEPAAIADAFWRLFKARDEIRARIG
ncbi:SDR family NAD(P)-dependent oxidoreductase [Phenylobacterium sp.]|uniref:SDR family NAD(P)-dependent oxidoreductase n=1 Tax=Phenylobacterium sp. TaxID=1871053 RepID=UPI00120D2457|nr:SDR family NAD(P)-dependent oxidoreductase [Phenylobacterium sp.]THD70237.1 MAG: SDR family NAD(P)-dependent oxidoreductase [Phenylobacterium sp.]